MMCTTVLHGGVCNRTSTPDKSGNKVKEKKKIRVYSRPIMTVQYLKNVEYTCWHSESVVGL